MLINGPIVDWKGCNGWLPAVKINRRYQVTLPVAARARLKIHKGDRLIVDIQDGMLILVPEPGDYTQELAGLHQEIWGEIDAQRYVNDERSAWDSGRN